MIKALQLMIYSNFYTPEIREELIYIHSPKFILGEYIYMAMALVDGHRVCIATAYKIDYCIKKAMQFVEKVPAIEFTHINKVKTGETQACKRFLI
ncbi:hypothetical protein [Candidatus Ornithobacterium hominis]|uniref:hypothetical protein n=1 Tax=Candidatus Ornithobacterium hominis TaxID=2497989 RepID=UPI0024BD08E2|nr:hypothetical protein [Candidatus Ornithobacterium hominis]